jgi:hypothetical protein
MKSILCSFILLSEAHILSLFTLAVAQLHHINIHAQTLKNYFSNAPKPEAAQEIVGMDIEGNVSQQNIYE